MPINYDLKSSLEKESILNSYKLFLKSCDFNIQILIQSKKENVSKNFLNLKNNSQKENPKIQEMIEKYIEFVKQKSLENKASTKDFFIILKYENESKTKDLEERNLIEKIAINNLNENFFKIKEALSRCGNTVSDINSKNEAEEIFYSFFDFTKIDKGE